MTYVYIYICTHTHTHIYIYIYTFINVIFHHVHGHLTVSHLAFAAHFTTAAANQGTWQLRGPHCLTSALEEVSFSEPQHVHREQHESSSFLWGIHIYIYIYNIRIFYDLVRFIQEMGLCQLHPVLQRRIARNCEAGLLHRESLSLGTGQETLVLSGGRWDPLEDTT